MCGLATAGLALAWQFFIVSCFHSGDWTPLFRTSAQFAPPQEMALDRATLSRDSGYDGQFYRYVAHDPFLRTTGESHLDSYAYRYERILVPLLAYSLALGNTARIDIAYVAVVLAFVGLGAYWLSEFASAHGYPQVVGVAFLAVPATAISLETMTVDVALIALLAGFAVLLERGPRLGLLAVLAAAPLVRETGVVLIAAYGAVALFRRNWRDLVGALCAALPWAAWLAFVRLRAGPNRYSPRLVPLSGTIEALQSVWSRILAGTEVYVAVLDLWLIGGILLGAAMALSRVRRDGPMEIVCGIFALLVVAQQAPDLWANYHALGRVFSPLALGLALRGASQRNGQLLLPIVLMTPRFLAGPVARLIHALS